MKNKTVENLRLIGAWSLLIGSMLFLGGWIFICLHYITKYW